jgi:hypothetical protein
MPSRVRNVRRDAMNPLQGIQRHGGCPRPCVGRRFPNQDAVVESEQRIHSHYRMRDASGLRFNRSGLSINSP